MMKLFRFFLLFVVAVSFSACAVKLMNTRTGSSQLNTTQVSTATVATVSPPAGGTVGGTTITISGSGFSSGGSFGISVGSMACTSATVVSSTTVLCVVPAQPAGTYAVTVTNKDGTKTTLANAFTYNVVTTTKIAARGYATCALTSNKTVECWGDNMYGNLGNGTTTYSGTPVQISGLVNAVDISVGQYHTCAVISDGSVKCWGLNEKGELGNGTFTSSSVPVTVTGISTALKVSTGQYHSCAILSAAPWIKCWGNNGSSELGNAGAGASSSTPVIVSPGAMPVLVAPIEIASGSAHTCVIDGSASQNVWCWGWNASGQVGNGSTVNSGVAVKAGTVQAGALSVNFSHSCAVATAGTVWCWGDGTQGQFMSNSGSSFLVPTQSANASLNASQVTSGTKIATGQYGGCAVLSTGNVTCWGGNRRGFAGMGSDVSNSQQVPFNNTNLTNISQLAAGWMHMCALTTAGTVKCWGHNAIGSTGTGITGSGPHVPVTVASLNTAVQIAGSKSNEWQCARLSNGDVYCWGTTRYGLEGTGSYDYDTATPVKIPNASMGAAIDLAVGPHQACIVNTSNLVWCWGADGDFIMSAANTWNDLVPQQQAGIVGATRIYLGYSHACAALNVAPYMKCWGQNDQGQLGNGAALPGTGTNVPQAVLGLTSTPTVIGGTGTSMCVAISASPYIKCWGQNANGELADGTTLFNSTPGGGNMAGLTATPLDISQNGFLGICAVTTAGGMKCWGLNSNNNFQSNVSRYFYGVLGDGTNNTTGTNAAVTAGFPSAVTGASKVGGGTYTMCAVFNPGASGTVDCWGANPFGEVGASPTDSVYSRTTLPGSGYVSVFGSDNTTCALMNNNTVQCFGDGSGGQLGDGIFRHVNTPTAVMIF